MVHTPRLGHSYASESHPAERAVRVLAPASANYYCSTQCIFNETFTFFIESSLLKAYNVPLAQSLFPIITYS